MVFAKKVAREVIFMSHQWTAFDEPDHTGLQYKGMVEAVDTVMQKNGWENEAKAYTSLSIHFYDIRKFTSILNYFNIFTKVNIFIHVTSI